MTPPRRPHIGYFTGGLPPRLPLRRAAEALRPPDTLPPLRPALTAYLLLAISTAFQLEDQTTSICFRNTI